jgi:segregation and condensation protein B
VDLAATTEDRASTTQPAETASPKPKRKRKARAQQAAVEVEGTTERTECTEFTEGAHGEPPVVSTESSASAPSAPSACSADPQPSAMPTPIDLETSASAPSADPQPPATPSPVPSDSSHSVDSVRSVDSVDPPRSAVVEPPVTPTDPTPATDDAAALHEARTAFATALSEVAAVKVDPPLDPALQEAVMGAAIAAIEGARPRNIAMALEALLFSTNQPLTEGELAIALSAPIEEVKAALVTLEKTLAERASSISLWSRAKNGEAAYILDVKAAFRRDVAVLAPPALRVALVETLALIALNQPVSQRRLVSERGSTVYEHVKELMELGYITRQRRGINFYLKTTPGFANEFGLPNEPEAIRHALAKAAGLAGTPGAIASERVWIDGQAPASLQATAEEAAAIKRAEEEAAAKAAAEAEAEAKRLAEEANRAEEEAAAKALAEAAIVAEKAAAEAKRLADETAAEAARLEAAAKRVADEEKRIRDLEEARVLAIAAACRESEECVVQGGDLEDVAQARKSRSKKKNPNEMSDTWNVLGGNEVAW